MTDNKLDPEAVPEATPVTAVPEATALVQHATSATSTPAPEPAPDAAAATGKKDDKKKEKKSMVPILSMFRFATPFDYFLMFVGAMCGIANGASMAGFSVILGDLFDVLNGADSSKASDIALIFVWLGIALFVAAGLQVGLWTAASERMTIKLRQRFLDALLSQDVSFFDRQDAGMITSKISENSILFREALGEKFAAIFQLLSMFIGGLIVSLLFSRVV